MCLQELEVGSAWPGALARASIRKEGHHGEWHCTCSHYGDGNAAWESGGAGEE